MKSSPASARRGSTAITSEASDPAGPTVDRPGRFLGLPGLRADRREQQRPHQHRRIRRPRDEPDAGLLANAAGVSRTTATSAKKFTASSRCGSSRGESWCCAAASTGFRAPGLAQSWYSHTTTAIQNGVLVEIGNFPVTNRASRIFGAKPLKEETSVNLSAGLAWSPTQASRHARLLPHRDQRPHPARRDVRRHVGSRGGGHSGGLGITSIVGVQFPTNALDTKTDGVDVTAS